MKPLFQKSLFPLVAALSLGLTVDVATAEPLRLRNAAVEGRAKVEYVQAQNDVDRAVSLVRRRMAGRGNFVSAERLDDYTFRVTWKDGNRILTFRVNVRDNSVDDE